MLSSARSHRLLSLLVVAIRLGTVWQETLHAQPQETRPDQFQLGTGLQRPALHVSVIVA